MNQGRDRAGRHAREVYDQPATPFVYEFLGDVNRLPCTVARGRARLWNQDVVVDLPRLDAVGPAVAYVRPEDIDLFLQPMPDAMRAQVMHVAAFGPVIRIELAVAGSTDPMIAELGRTRFRQLGLTVGDHAFVRAREARVFEAPVKIAA